MKLISMTDYVLEQNKLLKNAPDAYDQYCKIVSYAQFLKQPLTLGMFVPCDEEGNVLEEPLHIELYEGDTYDLDCKIYNDAKLKVLFKGITLTEWHHKKSLLIGVGKYFVFYDFCDKFKGLTIENLIKYNLDLAVSF